MVELFLGGCFVEGLYYKWVKTSYPFFKFMTRRKEIEWVHSETKQCVSISLAFRQMRLPPQPLGTAVVAAAKHPSAAPTSRPHPSLTGPTCSCSSQASLHFTCLTCPGCGCHAPTQSPLLASVCVHKGAPKGP